MNKDEVISNICRLSVNYKTVGSKSINDWIAESGWLSYKSSITVDEIKEFLTSNPYLIDNWLVYSADKRTSSGWYFKENVNEGFYIVGYFEENIGSSKETKYFQSIDACAHFIINEFMEHMKLLGQFNRPVGLQYQSLLEEAGVNVIVEDWGNSFELTAGFALVRLLVSEQDYEKSVNLIQNFENNASKQLTGIVDKTVGKEFLKALWGIIFRAAIILGIITALFFVIKYYNTYIAKKSLRDGIAECKKGNYAQGIIDFSKVIKIFPYDANAYFNRGVAYSKLGNLNYAITDYYRAIAIDPEYAKAYNNRGLAFYRLGNLGQAISDYSIAIDLNHRYTKPYINRGLAFNKQKDFTQAIEDFSQAIEIDPNDAQVYNNRGYSYSKEGQCLQAISDFTRAIELDPKDPIAYNNRGYIYAKQGNLSLAFNDLNKALEIDPKNKYAYFSRGFAYFKAKEYDKSWLDVHKSYTLGNKPDKEDEEFIEELKKVSGRDK